MVEETYSHLLKSITINNVNLSLSLSPFPTHASSEYSLSRSLYLSPWLDSHFKCPSLSLCTDNNIQIVLRFNDRKERN